MMFLGGFWCCFVLKQIGSAGSQDCNNALVFCSHRHVTVDVVIIVADEQYNHLVLKHAQQDVTWRVLECAEEGVQRLDGDCRVNKFSVGLVFKTDGGVGMYGGREGWGGGRGQK